MAASSLIEVQNQGRQSAHNRCFNIRRQADQSRIWRHAMARCGHTHQLECCVPRGSDLQSSDGTKCSSSDNAPLQTTLLFRRSSTQSKAWWAASRQQRSTTTQPHLSHNQSLSLQAQKARVWRSARPSPLLLLFLADSSSILITLQRRRPWGKFGTGVKC